MFLLFISFHNLFLIRKINTIWSQNHQKLRSQRAVRSLNLSSRKRWDRYFFSQQHAPTKINKEFLKHLRVLNGVVCFCDFTNVIYLPYVLPYLCYNICYLLPLCFQKHLWFLHLIGWPPLRSSRSKDRKLLPTWSLWAHCRPGWDHCWYRNQWYQWWLGDPTFWEIICWCFFLWYVADDMIMIYFDDIICWTMFIICYDDIWWYMLDRLIFSEVNQPNSQSVFLVLWELWMKMGWQRRQRWQRMEWDRLAHFSGEAGLPYVDVGVLSESQRQTGNGAWRPILPRRRRFVSLIWRCWGPLPFRCHLEVTTEGKWSPDNFHSFSLQELSDMLAT